MHSMERMVSPMETAEIDRWLVLLNSIEFFKPFSGEEKKELLRHGQIKKYSMHEYIIKEESVESGFFVLLKGKVNVLKDDPVKRRKVKIAQLGAGAVFGEMAMLLNGHRSANVMAAGETFSYVINSKEVDSMNPGTQFCFIKQVAFEMARKLKAQNETFLEVL